MTDTPDARAALAEILARVWRDGKAFHGHGKIDWSVFAGEVLAALPAPTEKPAIMYLHPDLTDMLSVRPPVPDDGPLI